MRLLKNNIDEIELEGLLDEFALLERALSIPLKSFEVRDFVARVGGTEAEAESIRHQLRSVVDANKEYHKLRMEPADTHQTKVFTGKIKLSQTKLPLMLNVLKVSRELAGEEEFHTLTGFSWDESLIVQQDLEQLLTKFDK